MMIRWVIILVSVGLFGCSLVPEREVSLQAHQRALELVDAGTLELRAGNLNQARAHFELAMDLADLPAAVDGLGCVLFAEGDLDLAEERFFQAYDMAQERGEEYDNALANAALLFEAQGKLVSAEQLYARAIEINSENFRVRNNYAAFLVDYKRGVYRDTVRHELLKAQAVYPHPVVAENLESVEEL